MNTELCYIYCLYGCYDSFPETRWRNEVAKYISAQHTDSDRISLSLMQKDAAESTTIRPRIPSRTMASVPVDFSNYRGYVIETNGTETDAAFDFPSYLLFSSPGDIRTKYVKVYDYILDLSMHSDGSYGIMYNRSRDLGPTYYAVGLVQGLGVSGEDHKESLRISRWWHIAVKKEHYKHGVIRDVYDENIFNATQWAVISGNMAVAKYLAKSPHVRFRPHGDKHILSIDAGALPEARKVFAELGEFYFPNVGHLDIPPPPAAHGFPKLASTNALAKADLIDLDVAVDIALREIGQMPIANVFALIDGPLAHALRTLADGLIHKDPGTTAVRRSAEPEVRKGIDNLVTVVTKFGFAQSDVSSR